MQNQQEIYRRMWSYVVGYLASALLTGGAFWLAWQHVTTHHMAYPHTTLIPLLLAFALVQLFVQLFFFLHLGKESKPRFNLYALLFAVLVMVIIVGGSLWIMQNLNYHMMTPNEMQMYMHNHEGI
jgi:cytochrome o ubiquinol oxidase operon protein cyoD